MRFKISPLLVFLLFLLMSSNLILFLTGNSPIYAMDRPCKERNPECEPTYACELEMEEECQQFCQYFHQVDCDYVELMAAWCVEYVEGDCACFSNWEFICQNEETHSGYCWDHNYYYCYEEAPKK